MGLRELMERHRDAILRLTRETVQKRSTPQVTAREFNTGMPHLLRPGDRRLAVCRGARARPPFASVVPRSTTASRARRGGRTIRKELRRLGFSAAQVVHVYGALCEATTRLAAELHVPIEATEFNLLNRRLDDAIGISTVALP
jgi:hypothetical protein